MPSSIHPRHPWFKRWCCQGEDGVGVRLAEPPRSATFDLVHHSDYPEQPLDEAATHEVGKRTYVVADVEPLDVDGTRTVAVGAALFLVAFLALLPFRGQLADAGRTWWLWSCLAGFALGLVGYAYCRRRRSQRRAGEGV